MKQIPIFIILSIVFLVSLGMLDFYLSEKLFCTSCDFDDDNVLFKLFYNNDSNIGYHSEPTLFNIIFIFFISFYATWLILKKVNHLAKNN